MLLKKNIFKNSQLRNFLNERKWSEMLDKKTNNHSSTKGSLLNKLIKSMKLKACVQLTFYCKL